MSERSLHLRVAGRVQGVGYRAFARAEARRLGLRGWVVNRDDGAVEVVAHGDGAALGELVGRLRQGPPGSQVSGLDVRSTDRAAADEVPAEGYAF